MATKGSDRDLQHDIIKAALACAADKGWMNCSLADIAGRADIKESELRIIFPEKADILRAFGRMVDKQIAENLDGSFDDDLSPRDKLFDIMMERFDILNDDRDGLCAILDSVKCDPKQAIIGLPHLGTSMSNMLDIANIDSSGFFGAAKVFGLVVVYLDTLRTWKTDDSPDMGKTMVVLDKGLERAEALVSAFENKQMPQFDFIKRNN